MRKNKPLFNTVAIVGVGLIGGSLGLAIKKNKLAKQVIGIGHRQSSIKKAIIKRAIDKGFVNLNAEVKQADLVVLAVPVGLIIEFLKKITPYLKPGAIVIDVGSSKEDIVKVAEKTLPRENPFVGCHPIAGSEKRGIDIAGSDLFNEATCFITPGKTTTPAAFSKIKELWRSLGSKVQMISPAQHDRLTALFSHLPHLVSVGLVLKLINEKPDTAFWLKLVGPGFKDTTRIAASSPAMWQDIYFSNRVNILKDLAEFRKIIEKLEGYIKNNRRKELLGILDRAKKFREKLK